MKYFAKIFFFIYYFTIKYQYENVHGFAVLSIIINIIRWIKFYYLEFFNFIAFYIIL